MQNWDIAHNTLTFAVVNDVAFELDADVVEHIEAVVLDGVIFAQLGQIVDHQPNFPGSNPVVGFVKAVD